MHKVCVEIYRIEWLDLLVKCGICLNVVTYLVLLLPSSVRVKVCHCFVLASILSIKWLNMVFGVYVVSI